MLETGSIVDGKYKIVNKEGSNGAGIIYTATNRSNELVAVKEFSKKDIDIELMESLYYNYIREFSYVRKLDHRNIPKIYDIFDNEESLIVVLEYINGENLKSIIKERGVQPQELVVEWAKQLCDVLAYFNSREPAIIYLDTRPDNIMLLPDGRIMLVCFDMVQQKDPKSFLGVVGYAAPEQFAGMGQIDPRTDIYHLGATLYYLVTGCDPSEPPYEICSICEKNPLISSGLEKIIMKCTQRTPDDRYQTPAELMYALEHDGKEKNHFLKSIRSKLLGKRF